MEDSTAPPPQTDVIVVSGLSGSGKTTVLRALEDVGYFCVDNLPMPLLERFLELSEQGGLRHLAVSVDIRSAEVYPDAADHLAALSSRRPLRILFLDCNDGKVIARFKTTRRNHPLQLQGEGLSLADAIARERQWLVPLRTMATAVIDTTQMNVHDLKRRVHASFGRVGERSMALHLMSFGFRLGSPREADYVFDVRFIDNPYYDETLRPLSGLDAPVRDFVLGRPEAQQMLEHLERLLVHVIPLAEREGKASLTVAVGCTGGQHRSVAMTEALAERLRARGQSPTLGHRDVQR